MTRDMLGIGEKRLHQGANGLKFPALRKDRETILASMFADPAWVLGFTWTMNSYVNIYRTVDTKM
jgi:hypothetical protein